MTIRGCTIVLTSRNKLVLSNEMGTQKDMPVLHLPEKEALVLFKKIVGDSINKPDLQAIVINVAKECVGLPIALVTIAKALKKKECVYMEGCFTIVKKFYANKHKRKGCDGVLKSGVEL